MGLIAEQYFIRTLRSGVMAVSTFPLDLGNHRNDPDE
jgi:hypothetical protein